MKNKGIHLEEIQLEKREKIQALEQIYDAVEAKNIRYQPSLLQIAGADKVSLIICTGRPGGQPACDSCGVRLSGK